MMLLSFTSSTLFSLADQAWFALRPVSVEIPAALPSNDSSNNAGDTAFVPNHKPLDSDDLSFNLSELLTNPLLILGMSLSVLHLQATMSAIPDLLFCSPFSFSPLALHKSWCFDSTPPLHC